MIAPKVKRAIGTAAGLVALLLAGHAIADADPAAQAEAKRLFDEARALSGAERHAEACPLLAESQRLDPSMGTEFYLAECLEKTGRLVAARDHYLHVAEVARASERTDRAAFAIEKLGALERRIPSLVVKVGSPPPGLVVEVQGAPLAEARWGAPMLVDPGDVAWSARAPGKKPRAGTVKLAEGARATLAIDPLEPADEPAPLAPTSSGEPAPEPDPTQLAVGVIVGATGLAAAAMGTVFGLIALDDYGASEDGPCDAEQRCTAEGLALRDDADTAATVSTIGLVAGGVLVAGGLVLILTSPTLNDDETVAVRVRPTGGDLTWRF